MDYTIFTEPNYPMESITLIASIVRGETIKDKMDESMEKYAGSVPKEDIEGIYAQSLALEEYVRERLTIDDVEKTNFLFQKFDGGEQCLAFAFYFYNLLRQRGIQNKIASLMSLVQDDFLDEDLDDKDFPRLVFEDLFRKVESSELGTDARYAIFKLNYNFDSYYECYTKLTEAATALIKEKIYLFAAKIDEYAATLEEGLNCNGFAFFKDVAGVEIMSDIHHDIRPIVYRLNSLSLYGAKMITHHLGVGVGFFALCRLGKELKPMRDYLPEFLKALSDNTKFNILTILKQEPMFGGQLAERLGLSSATISYHMNTLIKLEIVMITKEATKVYYRINVPKIKEFIECLESTLL